MPRHAVQVEPESFKTRAATARAEVSRHAAPVLAKTRRIANSYLRPILSVVSSLGWTLIALCVVCWVIAARFGWIEMAVATAACALLLIAALPFLVGPINLEVVPTIEPLRLTAGQTFTGHIWVKNCAKVPLVSAQLDFPIGTAGRSYDLPTLLPGKEYRTDPFQVRTDRRGVIPVGPVTSVRGDPMGIYRREVVWTDQTEIFVHPLTTPLGPPVAGLIRDLAGESSQHISMSDLSFYALREYVAGDDLRHVHWLSTARHGKLLVRQYLETRRSHFTAIVDSNAGSYRCEDDYEVAISAAASMMVQALREGYTVSFLSGSVSMTKRKGKLALDACSRARLEFSSMVEVAARGTRLAPETSLVLLVTGPEPGYLTLQRAASQFGVDTGRIALRVDSAKDAGIRRSGDMPVLTISRLDELGRALNWGVA